MTTPCTGLITMLDVVAEFAGNPPYMLKNYYGVASGVPTSGNITINDLRCKNNYVEIVINGGRIFDLTGYLKANYAASDKFRVTLTGTFYSDTEGYYALLFNDQFAGTGTIIEVINQATIIGHQGVGGPAGVLSGTNVAFGSPGRQGGTAIYVSPTSNITIIFNNTSTGSVIGGGGGGGGGYSKSQYERGQGVSYYYGGRGGYGAGYGRPTPEQGQFPTGPSGAGGSMGGAGGSYGSYGSYSGGSYVQPQFYAAGGAGGYAILGANRMTFNNSGTVYGSYVNN